MFIIIIIIIIIIILVLYKIFFKCSYFGVGA